MGHAAPAHFGNALAVQHLFGAPVRAEGVTVIPVAKFSGGGGGGGAEGGFGGALRPLGALVIEGNSGGDADTGRVYWRPISDTSTVLAVVGVGFTCFALVRALMRRHARHCRKGGHGCCGRDSQERNEGGNVHA